MERHVHAQADCDDDGWMFLDPDEVADVKVQAADDVVVVIAGLAALIGTAALAVLIKRRSRDD